jgi:hypothetical protein
VLSSVSRYLGVVPLLTTISVFHSIPSLVIPQAASFITATATTSRR